MLANWIVVGGQRVEGGRARARTIWAVGSVSQWVDGRIAEDEPVFT